MAMPPRLPEWLRPSLTLRIFLAYTGLALAYRRLLRPLWRKS